jgi:DNA-directed RNA polymerase specialized sigma24 family protein
MSKPKSDSDQILAALDALHTRLEDIFILEASKAGVKQQEIRAILGIDMARVTRIAKHVKEEK